MPKQKSIARFFIKAKKSNTFPNITTAYTVLGSDRNIGTDASDAITENNRKAP